MDNRGGRLTLMLTAVVLLVVLAVGAVAPNSAGAAQVGDGLHGLWADPHAGGGSDGG